MRGDADSEELPPSWITPRGKDGRAPRVPPDAAGKLKNLADSYVLRDRDESRIVVGCLVKGFSAVAVDATWSRGEDTTKYDLCWQPEVSPQGEKHDLGLGLGSVFFAAVALGLVQNEYVWNVEGDDLYGGRDKRQKTRMRLKRLLDCATRVTQEWVKRQRHELVAGATDSDHQSRQEFRMCLTYSKVTSTDSAENALRVGYLRPPLKKGEGYIRDSLHPIHVLQCKHTVGDLDQVKAAELKNCGLVPWRDTNGKLLTAPGRIEMWRGTLDIDQYVCRQGSKRRVVSDLRDRINRFVPREANRPLAGVLVASPGTGKTNFVRQLTKQLDIEFLAFNVTNLIRREAVLACFDQIVTAQADLRGSGGKRLLVFFDEINAQIEGQHVYDLFLTPLDDGYYVRGGLKLPIRPCLWFFAGTRRPGAGGGSSSPVVSNTKASDFMSRMTLDEINLDGDEREKQEHQLEMVYLGLTLARGIYPDLSRATQQVIDTLASIKIGVAARSLRTFLTNHLAVDGGCGRWRRGTNGSQLKQAAEVFGPEGMKLLKAPPDDDEVEIVIDYS